MCGICGILDPDSPKDHLRDSVSRMCAALLHRGPDDEGLYVEDGFAMGVRRLSIVDVDGGHQPFTTPDSTAAAIMNGEIYNFAALRAAAGQQGYAFRSRCDTEAMLAHLHLHGIQGLADLHGIYTLVYWRSNEKRLLLARDPLGVKPLYLYRRGQRVVFASEIKALLASGMVPRDLDLTGIASFFGLGYFPGCHAALADVQSLPPAGWVEFSASGMKAGDFSRLPPPADRLPAGDLSAQVADRIRLAVRGQLTGDVPIGVLLSAGLDSNTVLHCMREVHNGPLRTYTAAFSDPRFDESDVAAASARQYRTDHTVVQCSAQDLVACFSDLIATTGNLIANTAAYPIYRVCQAAGKDLKVVLSGLGGDELFFGYPTYQADRLAALLRPLPAFAVGLLQGVAARLPVSHGRVSWDYKARKFFSGIGLSPELTHYHWRTIFEAWELRGLLPGLPPEAAEAGAHVFRAAFANAAGTDLLHQANLCDFATWLAGMALPLNDSYSMAHSVELRVPLLDPGLVDWILRLPRSTRFTWRLKPLLRRSVRHLLRDDLCRQPKQGFHIPLASWLCREMRPFLQERLLDPSFQQLALINQDRVACLVEEHLARRADHSYRLWNLLVFGEWHRTFIER